MNTDPNEEELENGYEDREDADRWVEEQAELELIEYES